MAPPRSTATTGPPVDRLAADRRGTTGPRLVLAHGFTQTRGAWGPVADDLANDHRLVLVDLPGHGGSSGVAADLPRGARLLADAGGAGSYLGY
ncbi:MAG: alpha/beta fold hydrolase, partial [Actinomycetota bacterium]|nr:alpha/beta fold hydrolase [Actinomycetota bacterium]